VQTYQQTARHYVFLFFESAIKNYTQSMQTGRTGSLEETNMLAQDYPAK